jgi:cell division protein FtsB
MNTSNEAILALLLELKAEMAGLKREIASLKAADAKILDKVELLNSKLTYLAEEMGMI